MFFQKKGLVSHLKSLRLLLFHYWTLRILSLQEVDHVSKKSIICQFKKERQYDEVVYEGPTKDWTMNVKTCLHYRMLTFFYLRIMLFCLKHQLKSPNWYLGSWFFPSPKISLCIFISSFSFFYDYSFNFKALFRQKCTPKDGEDISQCFFNWPSGKENCCQKEKKTKCCQWVSLILTCIYIK